MIKVNLILKQQSGVALVIALIMMVIFTLIGLASTFSSNFEVRLSGNKRGSTNAFYAADAGVQSVMANLSNFNMSGNFVSVSPSTLPIDLQNQSIDSKFSSPSLALPSGFSFNDIPSVTIYHTNKSNAPRGLGFSATGNVEYEHYFVDSTGRDQMEVGLLKSNSQVREKVVRLVPTSQGGN